jgi:hypothetical protein
MTAKKQRNRLARQLCRIGIPWADAHKLAKRFHSQVDVRDCVSVPFTQVITGSCPDDDGPIGFFSFPHGRINFDCGGLTNITIS